MRKKLYARIAMGNLKKNYRFFIPRVLAEAGLIACFYIVMTLHMDPRITQAKGGNYIPFFMELAILIIGLLSMILMFYINSFLMKQRTRELGLYNILGMEKKHVGKVLFFETFFCSSFSILLGIVLGLLFYKLCSLLIFKLLHAEIVLGLGYIKLLPIAGSALYFVFLDFLTLVFNRIRLKKLKPVELLDSRHTGEREPKVKWVLLALGILSLGAGYFLAVFTTSAFKAAVMFFPAVILVIIGTYLIFVSGSIYVLKALKKKKAYYYNKKHFTSVSGLLYRMKQNAVGLASIAILATGVLVMISCTVSLYSGMEDTLMAKYKYEMYLEAHYDMGDTEEKIPSEILSEIAIKAADENGLSVTQTTEQKYLQVYYLLQSDVLYCRNEVGDYWNMDNIRGFNFITADTYNKLTGSDLVLENNQIAVSKLSSEIFEREDVGNQLTVHGMSFIVTAHVDSFPIESPLLSGVSEYGIIVSDETVLDEIYTAQKTALKDAASEYVDRIAVRFSDRNKVYENGENLGTSIFDGMNDYVADKTAGEGHLGAYLDSVWSAREEVLGMYSSFLFLGIILGIVCMFATVLIIYYKQISEGYEDRERFQIMKKVGMSSDEIRTSIRTQILWVFFLPLIVAGIHICFASPLLMKILKLLMLSDSWLFIGCLSGVYAAFALVYILIYTLTARTYYKIIN